MVQGLPAPPCGGGPLGALILLIVCFPLARFSGLVGASPSPPLWLWAPLGADFVHFACLWLVFGGWWGPRPRPLCGCGPLWMLISFILLVWGSFFGAGWGFALAPLWLWAPSGADFVHFACFGLVLGRRLGASPSSPLWCGPPCGLILLVFACFVLVSCLSGAFCW